MRKLPFTDLENGLSSQEARKRLVMVGANEFEQKREYSVGKLLVSQFMSPLIYVLLFAGAVTIYLKEWLDTAIILGVVVVNATLGFWQEWKAAKSLEALKSYLKPQVRVRRDGKQEKILMSKLVPGDIVLLDSGGSMPADGVVIEENLLSVNEALLTGESRPVSKNVAKWEKIESLNELVIPGPHDKKAEGFVYMGTTVAGGVGEMLVLATGNKTEMGKIAQSLSTTEEEDTPLQVKLAELAKVLMYIVVGATGIIMVIGVVRGEPVAEMFKTAVAMAVAAIPEGLAVSMTVILALGMQRILRRKALVRKLVAAETLGSVSVICCDKTGTLTEGKMRVVEFVGERDGLVLTSILANDERDEEGLAMSAWAKEEMDKTKVKRIAQKTVAEVRKKYERVDEIPFSSANKYMASLNRDTKDYLVSMAGAPEVVLNHSYMSPKRKREELQKIKEMAKQGYRLIGMASKRVKTSGEVEKKLSDLGWQGFLAFEDPLRPEVAESLLAARRAGVEVKVITGDYKDTAVAVLKKLLGEHGELSDEQVITGDELKELTQRQLKKRIGEIVLFARTTPDQKLAIVTALKEKGEVVAMTGDGVNDAPALKASDIGVVVNEASDVSKQTADMVLLNSNFKTIVEAIREGRVIYETMRKVVTYLLTDAFQELILIGGSLILGLPLPLTAIQILWINLVEDGLPGVALAFDLSDEGVMEEKPRARNKPILDAEIRSLILAVGIISNLMLLGLYGWLYSRGETVEALRTFMFVGVGTNSLLYIFSIKSLRANLWNENLTNNKFLLVAVLVGFSLMMSGLYVPGISRMLETVSLSVLELLLLLVMGLINITMIEAVKWIFIHHDYQIKIGNKVLLQI